VKYENEARKRLRTVAYDILYACDMMDAQEDEIAKLRKELAFYKDMAAESVKHGNAMFGQMLEVMLTPGVADCMVQNQSEDAQ